MYISIYLSISIHLSIYIYIYQESWRKEGQRKKIKDNIKRKIWWLNSETFWLILLFELLFMRLIFYWFIYVGIWSVITINLMKLNPQTRMTTQPKVRRLPNFHILSLYLTLSDLLYLSLIINKRSRPKERKKLSAITTFKYKIKFCAYPICYIFLTYTLLFLNADFIHRYWAKPDLVRRTHLMLPLKLVDPQLKIKI